MAETPVVCQDWKGEMIFVRQIKAARALLGWSQLELAERSCVSHPTIWRIEAPDDGPIDSKHRTADQIVATLRAHGIEFLNDGRIGVALRKRTRR
jgi:transcriptional regulator with XRE-family HTH domain